MREPCCDRAFDGPSHRTLVCLVRTGKWNRHGPQRQLERFGLRLEELRANGMHRHATERLVDRRQHRSNLDVAALAEHVNQPRAVLPRAPGNKSPEFGHWVIGSSGH
jgi:hypothetical protein